jgi:uncharacterized protein
VRLGWVHLAACLLLLAGCSTTPTTPRHRTSQAGIVDQVSIGDEASEEAHALAGENTRTGLGTYGQNMSVHWRDALWGGWFSYRLTVTKDRPLVLRCTYWGREQGPRQFDVLIDDKHLATENIVDTGRSDFFSNDIMLPEDLIAGKSHVTIKFQAHTGNLAGGLYGLTLYSGRPPAHRPRLGGGTVAKALAK